MTHPSNSYDTEQNSDFTRTDFSGNSDNKQPRWAKQSRLNLRTMLFEQFPDQAEEKLYQQYMRKQKLNAVPTLVVAGVIYTASQIGFEVAYISEQERRGQDVRLRQIIAHTLFLLVALLLFVPLQWCRTGPREWVVNVCVVRSLGSGHRSRSHRRRDAGVAQVVERGGGGLAADRHLHHLRRQPVAAEVVCGAGFCRGGGVLGGGGAALDDGGGGGAVRRGDQRGRGT